MSRSDDNFLARWSRRKRAAKAAAVLPSEVDEQGQGNLVPLPSVTGEEPPVEATQSEEGEPPEPLPRVEDLTPESDLSAFLRKGVPEALKLAALRRMWSLDPAIRDYVGPAEYAWNFNDPAAMAGFGPGDAAVGKVLPALSKIASRDSQEPAASAPATSPAESETPPEVSADLAGGVTRSADRDRDSSDAMAGASGPEPDAGAAPSSRTAEESGEVPRSPGPPRHGGALPR
jgi:hypothetical protein